MKLCSNGLKKRTLLVRRPTSTIVIWLVRQTKIKMINVTLQYKFFVIFFSYVS